MLASVKVALNWGCVLRVPTALVTRTERSASQERLPGDVAPEGWGIRVTASGTWAGRERIKDGARHLPALCQPTPFLPLHWPEGHQLAHCACEKADTGGGFRVAGAHSCTPAKGEPPLQGQGRGEKGGQQREEPPLCSSQVSSCTVGRGQCVGPVNRR